MSNDLILTILSAVVTAVVIPLITLAGNKLIAWLGTKTKNEKTEGYLAKATNIVFNAVKAVMQTYVDTLKKAGNFDAKAQAEALARAKQIVLTQTTPEVKAFIQEAYGDFEAWVNTQIEATVNTLKNTGK